MTGPDIDDEPVDHYELLGVDRDADAVALRAAYLAQAKRCHPDIQVNATPDQRQVATARFRAVREAWVCLSDPDRRAAYDRRLPSAASSGRRARPMPRPDPRSDAPPGDRRPSTWLARASLSAVASRLEDADLADDAVTQASAAVYRMARRQLDEDEPAPTAAAARRRAYAAARRAQSAWKGTDPEFRATPLLGDLVGQSLWVMCHELWAELGADQRSGLVEPPDTSGTVSSPAAGPCSVCGRLPAASFTFRAVRGQLLAYRASTIAGVFCQDCATGIGRDAQHVTLNAGWWGLLAVLRTPLALWTNGRALRRAAALAPAMGEPAHRRAPMDPGVPVLGRGITGAVLFGLLVLIVVAASRVI